MITKNKVPAGFTLVELLIVISMIAILASIIFIVIDPLARFQDSRNAQRWGDLKAIMSAIKLHQIDNQGAYIYNMQNILPDTNYQIGKGESTITCNYPDTVLDENCIDISELVDLGYLARVPIDPSFTNESPNPEEAYQSHYYLWKDSRGFISIGACNEEEGSKEDAPVISVTQ